MRTITYNGKEYTFGNVNENGVERELTDEEAIKFADMREADIVSLAKFKAEIEQIEADLSSAKTKLAGLGLTTDEVKAAFGI